MSETSHGGSRQGSSYSGEVWTDGDGRAVVALPPFMREHPAAFEYVLTPVGSPCSSLGVEMTAEDRFTIASDEPHAKVAWRVTALKEER